MWVSGRMELDAILMRLISVCTGGMEEGLRITEDEVDPVKTV